MSSHARTTAKILLGFSCLSGFAGAAHGFNPNEGAIPADYVATRQNAPLPAKVVPQRYYTPTFTSNPVISPARNVAIPVAAPAPVAPAPVAAVAPITFAAPTPVAAAPVAVRAVPAQQPVIAAAGAYPTPVYAPPAPYTPPAPFTPTAYTAAEAAPGGAFKANRFSLALGGYYDEYEENTIGMNEKGRFFSLEGSYEHYFNDRWFLGAEARGSKGEADYTSSATGSADNIEQWELEGRLLGGSDKLLPGGDRLKLYSGLGTRYFSDELKGAVSTTGARGYDRRITQFYIPIGATYSFSALGLEWAPNLEYDHLLYGHVQSRLQNLPPRHALNNDQYDGYGLRGELMVGKTDSSGFGWQAGPYFRYWDMQDSEWDQTPTTGGYEPANTRIQVGAKVKATF
ncbi:MAG: hypothetical protein V4735_09695 [Pseudomonadota bacterium]